jgi:hypothetical protein
MQIEHSTVQYGEPKHGDCVLFSFFGTSANISPLATRRRHDYVNNCHFPSVSAPYYELHHLAKGSTTTCV